MSQEEIEDSDFKGSINCLKCRHCRLLPNTRFEYSSIPIACMKMKQVRAINLGTCVIADGRYKRNGGDRVKEVTPAYRLFLKTYWPTDMAMEELERKTGTKRTTLRKLVRVHKICEAKRGAVGGNGSSTMRYTPKQVQYLESVYNTDDWPQTGGRGFGNFAEERKIKRRELVKRVAELGPRHNFRGISSFMSRKTSDKRKRIKKMREGTNAAN